MIIIDSLTKKYQNRKVLDNISLSVKDGEFIIIVGPSGAGKTTLLQAMIGALKPDNGRISIFGKDITQMNRNEIQDYRRGVGIIFQDFKLLPQKTVFENVAFALEVAGYDRKFIAQRTVDALKIVGLEERRNHFPSELSGGEAQRTAIARALVHDPQILFADEPTGNLDPENTMALAKLFKRINDAGTTVILSTHDKEVVYYLKKRIITLENGKLI